MEALTSGEANDQLLYFTSPSLTADDQTLVFLSDRDSPVPKASDPRAAVNLYALDRGRVEGGKLGGEVRRLSDNDEGFLRSYVYFGGLPYRGLGMASPCLHAASGTLYYLQGLELRAVDVASGASRGLATLPAGHVTGFTHVSDDNTLVCVPTLPEAAFEDIHAIDATVQALGLSSYLHLYDTRSGEEVAVIEVERAWVTHVQFRPGRRDEVLFNHEWPAQEGGWRRMWLWDGELRPLRSEGTRADGMRRSGEDWVCHEVWSPDGAFVLYHGTYADGPCFIGRVGVAGEEPLELSFAPHFSRYGHFSVASLNRLVSDGYAEFGADAGPAATGGRWISLLEVDWDERQLEWTPLCRHGSSWTSQDAHPHPVFSHAGDEVLFTSDVRGKRQIFRQTLGNR